MATTNFDTIAATFIGKLTGNVTGNVTGKIVGTQEATPDATSTASTEIVNPTEFAAVVTLLNALKATVNALIEPTT